MSGVLTRTMILGGRAFEVPPLPLGHNIEAYPLLVKLHNNKLSERAPTAEDLTDLSTILFICAKAADPSLTSEDFQALPVTPTELFAAWSVARFQSGGWVPLAEGEAPGGGEGEPEGEPKPPTSTSAESSPG